MKRLRQVSITHPVQNHLRNGGKLKKNAALRFEQSIYDYDLKEYFGLFIRKNQILRNHITAMTIDPIKFEVIRNALIRRPKKWPSPFEDQRIQPT
ncbi:MAG: hypothetical protein Ct9H300mP19_04390 [Dehalococcoidia bacterium]|nr:MAG: hypothetical protein Ct9H300mP19_04390 [Dehalococcoidia bacterium]